MQVRNPPFTLCLQALAVIRVLNLACWTRATSAWSGPIDPTALLELRLALPWRRSRARWTWCWRWWAWCWRWWAWWWWWRWRSSNIGPDIVTHISPSLGDWIPIPLGTGIRYQRCAYFVFVCVGPLSPWHWKACTIHIVGRVQIHCRHVQARAAISTRATRSPLRNKNRDLLWVLAKSIVQISVWTRVEVEGIHHVVFVRNRVLCRQVNILGPVCRACQDHRLRVDGTNGRNHGVVVAFDSFPAHTVGFVCNFIQHVFLIFEQLRHIFPERESVCVATDAQPVVGVTRSENVPVDHDVDSKFFAPLHDILNRLLQTWVTLVTALANVESWAVQINTPASHQELDAFLGVAVWKPMQPVSAHTHQLDRLSILIHQLRAFEWQFAMVRWKPRVIDGLRFTTSGEK